MTATVTGRWRQLGELRQPERIGRNEVARARGTDAVSLEEALPAGEGDRGLTRWFYLALPRLRRVVAGMGFAGAEGEDILQDTFVEVLRRGAGFGTEREATGWLIRVTSRRCLLEYRRRRGFRRTVERIVSDPSRRPAEAAPCLEEELARSEELAVMREVMSELDPSLLEPLVLRYFCDLNATEIGEMMQLPAGTVRSRLREARMVLARRMMGRGVHP